MSPQNVLALSAAVVVVMLFCTGLSIGFVVKTALLTRSRPRLDVLALLLSTPVPYWLAHHAGGAKPIAILLVVTCFLSATAVGWAYTDYQAAKRKARLAAS